jgi:hypothetical protein
MKSENFDSNSKKDSCKLSRREGGKKVERVSNIWYCNRKNKTNWLARDCTECDFILQSMALLLKTHKMCFIKMWFFLFSDKTGVGWNTWLTKRDSKPREEETKNTGTNSIKTFYKRDFARKRPLINFWAHKMEGRQGISGLVSHSQCSLKKNPKFLKKFRSKNNTL